MAPPKRVSKIDPLILSLLEDRNASNGLSLQDLHASIEANAPGQFQIRGIEKRATLLSKSNQIARRYRYRLVAVETHSFPVRFYRYFSRHFDPGEGSAPIEGVA